MITAILILTTVATALIAGLFYSYSCSVNIGLGRLPDREYILAMQSINIAILNPLFFLSFMGTLILLPVSCYVHYQQVNFSFILWAMIIYTVGVFGVTIFGNVPLNEMLAQFNLKSATLGEMTSLRARFEGPWNQFHSVRTVASIISLVLMILACVKK